MNKTKNISNMVILITLIFAFSITAKEITDQYGKTCHTFKVNQDMVEFVRIKGDKVFLYKEADMQEPLMSLNNKTFALLMDRDGKLLKIKINDGVNPPTEGWINKYQVFTNNDMITVFYGEDLEDKNSDKAKSEKDIDLETTSWVIKDVAKLYYDPLPESDFKYEIYQGLKLDVKKQRGDFYFVQIYNSILEEYRSGWVKIEDTGPLEFFAKEFEKKRTEYIAAVADMDTQISLLDNSLVSAKKEIVTFEQQRSLLELNKYESGRLIEELKIKKREGEDDETRKRNDFIANLENKIIESKAQVKEYQAIITNLERNLFKANSDIEKNIEKIAKLKRSVENIKAGIEEPEPVAQVLTYEEYVDEEDEKKTIELPPKEQQAAEEDKCSILKNKLNEKTARFEKVRSDMSKPISKTEYNSLYTEYMSTWTEIGQLKKDLSSCETLSKSQHIALYNEALGLKKDEEYDDALELLYQAVELKSDFDEAYFQIVSILIEMEDDKSVSEYIDKISDKDKKGKMYYKRALAVRDKYPKNAVIYLQTMAKFYKPALAFYQIGLIYSEKYSDYENSIKFLKKSVELEYEDPKTLEALGANFLELKPPKGEDKNVYIKNAIRYLEKAYKISADYKNKDVLCARLSQAYNLSGDHASALKFADTALEISNIRPFGFGHLEKGKALIKLNKKAEAKKHLLEAAKDMSTKTEAEFWLNEINN
jgi:hypothetical protein